MPIAAVSEGQASNRLIKSEGASVASSRREMVHDGQQAPYLSIYIGPPSYRL